ncbi:TPA: hypothetical protein ACG5U1_004456, partial [Escherichia coli]
MFHISAFPLIKINSVKFCLNTSSLLNFFAHHYHHQPLPNVEPCIEKPDSVAKKNLFKSAHSNNIIKIRVRLTLIKNFMQLDTAQDILVCVG